MGKNTGEIDVRLLISMANNAREKAWTPYSKFNVGAALLTKSGEVYTGCNIENAAFTPGNCAERTAFFKAVSEGEKAFYAIAVVGGPAGAEDYGFAYPCGVCRQVMMEFCDPSEFLVIVADSGGEQRKHTLEEILPFGFGPADLNF